MSTDTFSSVRTLKRALAIIQAYNRRGIACSLAYLPVQKNRPAELAAETSHYQDMLRAISEHGLDCDITLKLHQFGIYGDLDLARRSLTGVIEEARRRGVFVWIDMERMQTVESTIRLFLEMRERYEGIGICLQAYLRRTASDLEYLLSQNATIRLVKGFYNTYDITDWSEVTRNYEQLMERLISGSDRPAIATHDDELIAKAKELIRRKAGSAAEFQFFKGVRDSLAERLVREGYRARIYIEHGNLLKFLVYGLPTFDLWRNARRMLTWVASNVL